MGQSTILLINELVPGQTQAFTTVNDGTAALEEATNLSIDLDGTDPAFVEDDVYSLPILDLLRHVFLRVEGHVAELTLRVPSVIVDDPILYTNRTVAVANLGDYDITVDTDDEFNPGRVVVIPPGESRWIHIKENNVDVIGNTAFTIGGYLYGVPDALVEVTRYAFTDRVVFRDDFVGSVGSIGIPPASSMTFDIQKNDSSIGEFSVDTGGEFHFTQNDPEVMFAKGDVLTIITPAIQDPLGANIGITLRGVRI